MQCASKHKFPIPFQTLYIVVEQAVGNFQLSQNYVYKCFISDFRVARNVRTILHYRDSFKEAVPVFHFTHRYSRSTGHSSTIRSHRF